MSRCLITYQEIPQGQDYSIEGLKKLSPRLKALRPFPYSALEQRQEAALRAVKLSIQGVQPKLSACLNVAQEHFEIVDINGLFILKPPSLEYEALPANEDLTMHLARVVKIEVPFHGLIRCKDHSLTYFIKRFDRTPHYKKLAVEDFSQLGGFLRATKYDASLEIVIKLIERYTTFPAVEKVKLFERVLFCFLIGNEDMHLKNYSVITRHNKIELSPAYDLVNTTIVLRESLEEMALPLRGKKNKLTRDDLLIYLGQERLSLTPRSIERVLDGFSQARATWEQLLSNSFLPPLMREQYRQLLKERQDRLWG